MEEPKTVVITKSFNKICDFFGISEEVKRAIYNPHLLSNEEQRSPPENNVLLFIKIYETLFKVSGGDKSFMQHWFFTENSEFHTSPSTLCQTERGLRKVLAYLEKWSL